MAMVLPETSRMVNITAAQILIRNNFTLPSMPTKVSRKACSVSVRVCTGALWNPSSIVAATRGTTPVLSQRMSKVPTSPLRLSAKPSRTYAQWK